MRRYILRRVLLLIPVVLGVATAVFFIIHLIPGVPVEIMLGEQAQAADREQLRKTLGLDGTEIYGVEGERTPGTQLTLVIERRGGQALRVPVTCRLDTAEEVSVYEAGGVLQRFAQDFLAQAQAA